MLVSEKMDSLKSPGVCLSRSRGIADPHSAAAILASATHKEKSYENGINRQSAVRCCHVRDSTDFTAGNIAWHRH